MVNQGPNVVGSFEGHTTVMLVSMKFCSPEPSIHHACSVRDNLCYAAHASNLTRHALMHRSHHTSWKSSSKGSG